MDPRLAPAVEALSRAGARPSPEALRRLEGFFEGLYEANRVQNLTRVPPEEFAVRHFADSLLVAEAVPPEGEWLDIGCGPGFPCWPLALAFPGLRVVGLDGSARPLRFLRRHPLPNLSVVQGRAEALGERRFDVVTGRAVAPLAVQAEVSIPWAKVGGVFVPFRTPADQEAAQAFPARRLGAELERLARVEGPDGTVRLFPVYRKLAPTPGSALRSWAEIRSRPLA